MRYTRWWFGFHGFLALTLGLGSLNVQAAQFFTQFISLDKNLAKLDIVYFDADAAYEGSLDLGYTLKKACRLETATPAGNDAGVPLGELLPRDQKMFSLISVERGQLRYREFLIDRRFYKNDCSFTQNISLTRSKKGRPSDAEEPVAVPVNFIEHSDTLPDSAFNDKLDGVRYTVSFAKGQTVTGASVYVKLLVKNANTGATPLVATLHNLNCSSALDTLVDSGLWSGDATTTLTLKASQWAVKTFEIGRKGGGEQPSCSGELVLSTASGATKTIAFRAKDFTESYTVFTAL